MVLNQIKPIFATLLVSALIAVSCSQNQSNSNGFANTNLMYEEILPPVESKVCGSMYEVKYNGEEPKSFMLSQPLPEIWIVEKVGNQNVELNCEQTKIKLSEAARKLLQKHWIDRNEFNYADGYLGSPLGREGEKIDTKLMKSSIETEKQLTETPVSDEKNARNITSKEAEDMVLMIRDWSREVLKAVKKFSN